MSWFLRPAALTVVVAVSLAACGTNDPAPAATTATISDAPSSATGTESSDAPTTPAPTTSTPPAPKPLAEMCTDPQAPSTTTFVDATGGGHIAVSTAGEGSTVALLVPQSVGHACGWWPYAAELSKQGVKVVLFDHCGIGQSDCNYQDEFSRDKYAQLMLVAKPLRKEAKRFVLVGASYGGSLVTAAAPELKADAVVNLSGGTTGEELTLDVTMPKVTVPLLVAAEESEPTLFTTMKTAFAKAPAKTKKFVAMPNGHGWEWPLKDGTITPLGQLVTDWVKGTYPTN